MKKLCYFGLGLFFVAAGISSVFAQTVPADSKITKVVVYQDRALITRSASVQLISGEQEILFPGLPGTLEPDSISAKGAGQAKVKLFGARIITKQLESEQSPRIQELESKLESLRDRQAEQDYTDKILNEKWDFLSSIRAAQGTQIGKDLVTRQPAADEIQKLSLFLDQEFLAVVQKREQMMVDRRALAKEIDLVQREMGQLRSGSVKQEVGIAVDLEAASAGSYQLEISYRLPGASWSSVYEARADLDSNRVQLTAYGMIQQNTGEDWNDVSLELSTAKPSLSGTVPDLLPWYLSKYEPPQMQYAAKAQGSLLTMERSAFKKNMNEKEENDSLGFEGLTQANAPAPAEVAEARIESKGPSVQYVLPKKETILSNGQSKKSSIQVFDLPANFVNQAVPKLSPYAFLKAKVKNTSEALLLPGSVQIFLRGAFVGSSWINSVGTDEEFDLSLGANEKIRVTQKLLSRKESVSVISGFNGKTKTIEYSYLTTLENYEGKDAAVILLDHVPLPQHQEIKVDFNSDVPVTKTFEDKPNVFEWAFKIPAGQKQKVKLFFRVKHPADWVIQGL